VNSKIEEGSTEPEENFLNTIHYWTIIQKQWKFLGEFFTPLLWVNNIELPLIVLIIMWTWLFTTVF
jgi:hypothetical protein